MFLQCGAGIGVGYNVNVAWSGGLGKSEKTAIVVNELVGVLCRYRAALGFNGAETNCRIAHILEF